MYKTKKRYFHIFILSMTICFSSLAQNQSPDSTSLREGALALQFGIAGNFTLTSFQGTTISMKYQLSSKNAIRGGITLGGRTNDGSNTVSGSYADTSIGSISGKNSSSSQNISFTIQYLKYLNPNGPVHFYTAIGPSVLYSYSKSNSDNPYSGESYLYRDIYSSSSTQWGIGATVSAGVEWFPSRWFSLRAEYGESLQYQWGSSTSTSDYTYTTSARVPSHYESSGTSKGWSLGSSSVSFGLSVYW